MDHSLCTASNEHWMRFRFLLLRISNLSHTLSVLRVLDAGRQANGIHIWISDAYTQHNINLLFIRLHENYDCRVFSFFFFCFVGSNDKCVITSKLGENYRFFWSNMGNQSTTEQSKTENHTSTVFSFMCVLGEKQQIPNETKINNSNNNFFCVLDTETERWIFASDLLQQCSQTVIPLRVYILSWFVGRYSLPIRPSRRSFQCAATSVSNAQKPFFCFSFYFSSIASPNIPAFNVITCSLRFELDVICRE